MTLLKWTPTLLLASLLLSGCASPNRVAAEGPVTEQRYELPTLARASFHGRGELRLVPANQTVLVIETAHSIHEVLDVEIDGDRLTVGPERGVQLAPFVRPVYTLYINELERLDLHGSMRIEGERLSGNELMIDASGSVSGELWVEVESLTVAGSGSIDLTLAGHAERLSIRGSGSVDLDAANLQAREVSVSVSGSADLAIWAEDSLDISASGSTRVRYLGRPRVSQSISGSSSVEALEE